MEFFPGAFETEWERRRAMLVHEMQLGRIDSYDWDEPKRGGVARPLDEGARGVGQPRRRGGGQPRQSCEGVGSTDRSMRTRFAALARGSQPAVVKLASYGGGARAGAMMSYASRGGALAVENERGERVLGKGALAEQRAEWEHLLDNRAASRDLAVFQVAIDAASLRQDFDQDDQLRHILVSAFGDRRFVYSARERNPGEIQVHGVVVLRSGQGERLTGDRKAAEIVQQRHHDSEAGRDVDARFRFHGYGNGVEWGTARVRELVASVGGEVRDETGRLIDDATQAGDLVQKEWRKELHSRKGRDVMHLIVSARAGTDAAPFESAVREFLGKQFAGHRYVFAVHDPALDPKEFAEGGKRPHVHAHAIITMRSETGDRIVTSPKLFREWRSLMAEKAREQGLDMELTDRRELASASAYSRNQVRPVSYRDRTEYVGTSEAAHARYQAKRSNEINLATTDRSRQYAARAAEAWNDLANAETGMSEGTFASLQAARLEGLAEINQTGHVFEREAVQSVKNKADMIEIYQLLNGEGRQMREMTRPEFEAYEKRVAAVLASVERSLEPSEQADFNEVAAAAREVVDIRREYLEVSERQSDRHRDEQPQDHRHEPPDRSDTDWEAAVARHGRYAVERANEVLVEVERYREGLSRIDVGDLPRSYGASYQDGLAREINRAAEMAVDGDNQYMREVAKSDQELQRAIEAIELARREANRNVDREHHFAGQTSVASDGKDLNGSPSRATEADHVREADLDVLCASEERDGHGQQEASTRSAAEPVRSDPPQQHVPRLRQIEHEIEQRHERDRDDRER